MLGKTVRIRGEITAEEDVFIDGQVDGKIELTKNLTIGRNAEVQADVQALNIAISGKFQGTVLAAGRVEIDESATVVGNVTTNRVSIADGAFFKGSIEMTSRDREHS